MKTIKDLKAAVVIGTVWDVVHHKMPNWKPGPRIVSRHQSNSFAFKNPVTGADSWCDWPKASNVQLGENTFTILDENMQPELTYTKVEAQDTPD